MIKKIAASIILNYLRILSSIQLKKNKNATVIGVTGSAGKTSTRLAIAHILKSRGVVKQSVHANSESGIPLNILGLRPLNYSALDWARLVILAPLMLLFNWEKYNYYIVEMGIDSPDEPKNMSYLLKIITPHIGVVLNAGLTHAATFDHLVKDRDALRRATKLRRLIAAEKMRLVHGIGRAGVSVINVDQPDMVAHRKGIRSRQITFGKSSRANLRITQSLISRTGYIMRFSYQGTTYALSLPDIYTEGYASTFAAAIAAAAAVGVSPSSSVQALSSYRAPAGRLHIFAGIKETTIIDSSYNASPDTMHEALKLLSKLAGRARRLAVLGDMRELGSSTKLAHKNLADWVLKYCDEVILFGEATGTYTLPVLESKKFPVRHFTKMSELIGYLQKTAKPKEWILIKGSQNTILLERAVESLLEHKSQISLLCRRGSYWDELRATTL